MKILPTCTQSKYPFLKMVAITVWRTNPCQAADLTKLWHKLHSKQVKEEVPSTQYDKRICIKLVPIKYYIKFSIVPYTV